MDIQKTKIRTNKIPVSGEKCHMHLQECPLTGLDSGFHVSDPNQAKGTHKTIPFFSFIPLDTYLWKPLVNSVPECWGHNKDESVRSQFFHSEWSSEMSHCIPHRWILFVKWTKKAHLRRYLIFPYYLLWPVQRWLSRRVPLGWTVWLIDSETSTLGFKAIKVVWLRTFIT